MKKKPKTKRNPADETGRNRRATRKMIAELELRQVTGIDSADRRVRELREHHGYEIETIKENSRSYFYKLTGRREG